MATTGVSRQVRFRVPASDEVVLDWLEAQDNVSFSLRNMIRAFAMVYGVQDATCLPLEVSPVIIPAPGQGLPVGGPAVAGQSSSPQQGRKTQLKGAQAPVAKPTQNHTEQVSQTTPVQAAAPVEEPVPEAQETPSVAPVLVQQVPQTPAPTPALIVSDDAARMADINSLLDD